MSSIITVKLKTIFEFKEDCNISQENAEHEIFKAFCVDNFQVTQKKNLIIY